MWDRVELMINGAEPNQDWSQTIEWLLRVAEQGNSTAQYKLAVCYANGTGIKEDFFKAVEWCTRSAEQGNVDARNELALCYENGCGVEKDLAKAVEWSTKAAVQGNADAQRNLAVYYVNGKGVEKDYSKAFEWFQKAAEQGNISAQFNLALCYQRGNGVEPNDAKAVEWLRKAAEKGYPRAQAALAVWYVQGTVVEKDYSKAFEWFQKAAGQGFEFAQNEVGGCYLFGIGTEKNYSRAIEWFQKAADQGNLDAQNNLGVCYRDGFGFEKDVYKAFIMFKTSAEQGNEFAQTNLGLCYWLGIGIDEDDIKAFDFFQKAADQDYPLAQVLLAACYEIGAGIPQDLSKAIEWYKKAAEQGESHAQAALGKIYLKSDSRHDVYEGIDLLTQSASQSNPYALIALGDWFFDGADEKDYKKAKDYYVRAANSDDVYKECRGEAYYKLSRFYNGDERLSGINQFGEHIDYHKVKSYLEYALANGYDCRSEIAVVNQRLHIGDDENEMVQFVRSLLESPDVFHLYDRVEKKISSYLPKSWALLGKDAKNCLITGFISYVALVSNDEELYRSMDFSSAIVPMSKALEIELSNIFFDGMLRFFKESGISADKFDPRVSRFVVDNSGKREYVSSNSGIFTLGGFNKLFGFVKAHYSDSFATRGQDRTFPKLRSHQYMNEHILEYLKTLFLDDAFPGSNRNEAINQFMYTFSQKVSTFGYQIRNPAAHTSIMHYWDAQVTGNFLVMVDKIFDEIFSKIKPQYFVERNRYH